jgi:predicted transcriptional regulator
MVKDTSFTMRMKEEKRAELQKLADAEQRSLANYIDRVLDEHLAGKRKRPKRAVENNYEKAIDRAANSC